MPRPNNEVRQLLVHPVVWPPLLSWLKARNIELSAQKFGDDDLPTYVMTPSTVTREATRDQLDTYVRIFKHLPREAVAELVVAVTTDPDLHGRRTALAQAAMLVSVGHRFGWHDAQPAVVAAVAEEPDTETIHGCPPDGSGLTPCCGRTPFELPLSDRISSEAPITCTGPGAAASQPGKEA